MTFFYLMKQKLMIGEKICSVDELDLTTTLVVKDVGEILLH